jgi:predicted DsbA family dithiol-disulfide isomerase
MTLNAMPDDRQLGLAPLDEKADHVRGSPASPLILEYGDYECPYSRQAFHAIKQVERQLGGNVRFAFRHFPLTGIHPHAFAAAAAAEAAARQGRFWDMHELLFHRQKAHEDGDLRGYAAQLGLDVAAFGRDRASTAVADRIRRDVDSGLASGQVLGTPTLFIDGVVHRGGYDPPTLLAALATSERSEAEALADDDRGDPPGGDHLVDNEDVVHPAGHSVDPPGPGILERVAVLIDAPHSGGNVQ